MNFKLNEAEYRTVLEAVVSANDYIVLANADRRIRDLNRTPFGLDPEQFIGRDFVELAAQDQRSLVREAAERIGKGAPPAELEVKAAETGRWYSMRIAGNEDHGSVIGFAVSLHDIDETKRRQTERANLRAQLRKGIVNHQGEEDANDTIEHRLELLADALPVLVSYIDSDCRYQYNNVTYERWFAVSREEIRGRHMEEVLGKEAYARVRAMVETALGGQEVSFESELLYKNLGRRQVVSHYVPNVDTHGKVRGFFALIEDVTSEREAQAALRRRQDELRQLQKMEALGGFASSIAHEFNNLLQVVINGCNVVLLSSPEDSQVSRQIGRVVKAAQRGVSLTRRLLTFSRENQVQMEDLDLDDLLDDMAILLAFLLGSKVALKVDLQSHCRILGDGGLLQQVLMNLVINARDAMSGGGTLELRSRAIDVSEVEAGRHAGLEARRYAVLTVRDNGSGMDEKTRARIFDPFFTTKAPGAGTGLGLSTVYGIVQQLEGHIEVDSVPGEGTTFRLYLPALD